MAYITRNLENKVIEFLRHFPVVGITGPRQSGKSTMLKHLLSGSYRYISFDDFDAIQAFNADPQRFMNENGDRVIFDEAQRVPEIFTMIKYAVDNDRSTYGKFIIAGSRQFSLMKKTAESLAGRIGLLSLLPLQYSEIPKQLRNESVYLGGYPEQIIGKYENVRNWYSSYLETYLVRDVREISNIGNMRDFRRCLQLLAVRTAQILNFSDIARDLGVSVHTIKQWISILEASYIIFLLPPYYKNLGKRVIKNPKIYFYDTGLVSFLTGVSTFELFQSGPMYGAIFENYIISEILKRELHYKTDAELYFYRTSNGVEIDLLIDRRNAVEYIEIKSSETFRAEFCKSIHTVKKENDKGLLIYQGKNIALGGNVAVKNYEDYLKPL